MKNNDGVVSEEINRVSPVVPTYGREVATVLVIGAIVGLLTAITYYLLERFVFSAVLCREGADSSCADAPNYAMIVATVVGTIVGLVALVQARVYRPLLVVVGTAAALWGVSGLVADLAWYFALAIAVALYAVTYLLFSWMARIRSFIAALIVTALLIVAARFIIS